MMNRELWERLETAMAARRVIWPEVKGQRAGRAEGAGGAGEGGGGVGPQNPGPLSRPSRLRTGEEREPRAGAVGSGEALTRAG